MEEPTLWSVGVKASKSASLSIASANITTFFRIQSYFHKKNYKTTYFSFKKSTGNYSETHFCPKIVMWNVFGCVCLVKEGDVPKSAHRLAKVLIK